MLHIQLSLGKPYDDGTNTIIYINGIEHKRVEIHHNPAHMAIMSHRFIKELGYGFEDIVDRDFCERFAHFEMVDGTVVDFKRF